MDSLVCNVHVQRTRRVVVVNQADGFRGKGVSTVGAVEVGPVATLGTRTSCVSESLYSSVSWGLCFKIERSRCSDPRR